MPRSINTSSVCFPLQFYYTWGSNYLLCAWNILTEKENRFCSTTKINQEQVTHGQNTFEGNLRKLSLIPEFIQQPFIAYLTAFVSLC